MSEVSPTYDDEIDLIELFETLWEGKWKIIGTTFVAAVVGVVFNVVKPNSFEVSTPIQTAKSSVFLPYISFNNLLKEKGLYFDKERNVNGYKFDNKSIFEIFVDEFNDYEEMVDILKEDEFVKQSIKNLDDINKQKAMITFAKKFEIVAPSLKNENTWLLKFEWHDDYEGRRLFNNAINKTLMNIQNISKNSINELSKAIQIQNSLQLEKLQNQLKLIKQDQKILLNKKILFLQEQSAIATELGIQANKLDTSSLTQSAQNQKSLSFNSNDVPYYLRGSKAINKEIALIQSRTAEDIMLMANGYIELNKKISLLKNDISSLQLKNMAKLIESDNAENWVEFDMELANSKSLKKSIFYIALSIVLGGMVGTINVLISNAIRKHKG
mgnify:CR=1 FL=1